MTKIKISIIGMGYVGLPLACEFGRYFEVIGYDLSTKRINELNRKEDITNEVNNVNFKKAKKLSFTTDISDIEDCNVYIVCVPTPIKKNKKPDLEPIISASKTVGSVLKKNDCVIYESTVYPGMTREICVPILEKMSALKYISEFGCGYSPERVNPGDKKYKIPNIVKITSGSDDKTRRFVKNLYAKIIKAGVYPVADIETAEAAKVIENIQRDVNIALVNEFSKIFQKLNIDTHQVLDAASTKWNFTRFDPGLVGGHCIGIDPYYLAYKAKEMMVDPKIILSGRNINEGMVNYIAGQLNLRLTKKQKNLKTIKILILGLTFKEDCPDFRNSKIFDLIKILETQKKYKLDISDPYANFKQFPNMNLVKINKLKSRYDVIIITVPHKQYISMGIEKIKKLGKKNCLIMDIKSKFNIKKSNFRL